MRQRQIWTRYFILEILLCAPATLGETMTFSYLYLEHPHTGEWVTVGRYGHANSVGRFQYASAYLCGEHPVPIDPINLPLHDRPVVAHRYGGLHDVIRDMGPDSWGMALIRREHGLPENAPYLQYVLKASNADRWGGLAIGTSKNPSVAHLKSPKLVDLDMLVKELLAINARLPPVDARLRRKILATPSLGGARPKTSVQDGEALWLVKPVLPSDVQDIPLLEHAIQKWATAAGLYFAPTRYLAFSETKGSGISALLSLRFDREQGRRLMTLSAASMLQTEYPGAGIQQTSRWSYPRLADALVQVGAPVEDRIELFGRMVFNAIIGNDDDHPRNHAIRYMPQERRWRLAPAFDVVPETQFMPQRLAMRLGQDDTRISRETILAEAVRFGFGSRDAAADYLASLFARLESTFSQIGSILTEQMSGMLTQRLEQARDRLL